MASSTKDKDSKKAGHRRSSNSKPGDKDGSPSSKGNSVRQSSQPKTATRPLMTPQNSTPSTNNPVTPKAVNPMPKAADPTKTPANGAPDKSPSSNVKPTAPPTVNSAAASSARRVTTSVTPAAAAGGARTKGAAGADGAVRAPQQSAVGRYDSMGPGGMGGAYGSMGSYGYGSMGPGGMNGGYGSMGPAGMGYGMNPYGSMAGAESGMNGGYGSMYCGAPGSMYGMGAPMGGSMYGMGAPMGGSMYAMGMPMGGSMYGMGGPMGGSMYGMGGPMGGSMYGMDANSMYGGMNSMYGMGSMYGLGRYNSMGLGSNYASFYGVGRPSARSSFRSSGGYVGGSFGGLWRAPSGITHGGKTDLSIPPPSSMLSEPFPISDKAQEKKQKQEQQQRGKQSVAADAGAPAATKDGEKDAPTALSSEKNEEKKTPSVVVVGDADNKDKAKSRTVPLVLASSHRLTKQVNDNVHVVAIAPTASLVNSSDKTVSIDSVKYVMDEVFVGPVDVEKSDLLSDIVEQTQCGHNVSLLVLCGSQKYERCIATVEAVIRRMMEGFASEDTQVTQVMVSAVVFPESDKIVDLLQEGKKAEPVKAELGSNPIYGSCVMNTSEKRVETAEAAAGVVKSAAKGAAERGIVVVTYKIKQIRPATGQSTSRDVYVSSVLVAMVDDANMVHVKAAVKHDATCPTPLFSNAIGGASRTVAIVQIPESDTKKKVGDSLSSAQQLREIKNTPTRSGNVKRFVDYTERAAAANARMSPETSTKINRMLKDAKELLTNPEETPLVAYSLYGAAPASSLAKTPSAAATTPADAAARKETDTSGATPQTVQPKAASAAAVDAAEDDKKKSEPERRVKLTVCVDGTKAMPSSEVDEVVMRTTPVEVPESALLKSLRTNFCYGRNIALISAETQSSVALQNQYTWSCVDSILNKCLSQPAPEGKATTVELFMVVVQKRQVLCDLIAGGSAPKHMVIASSPLFGPIIAETKQKTLRTAAEVRPALEQALAAAPPHLKEMDAMIIMTAVMKQPQASGDVAVASFLCASGPSGAGVRGAMSKNPDYSRSLFAYAIGGPCVTNLLVSVGDDHSTNETAKSSLEDLQPLTKQPNHTSRDGSVNNFLEYAKKSIAANDARVERAATDEEKERLKVVSSRLQMMHDDYKTLVKFPQDNTPAYYVGEKRISAALRMGGKPSEETPAGANSNGGSSHEGKQQAATPIRSVVVAIDSGEGGAVAAGGALQVTEKKIVLNGEHYAPTEVVASKGGTLRSSVIDEVHQVALNGYNAAMLTNDIDGSTVGISMVVKTIAVILRGLPQNSEAFWTVVVSKDDKVKDMLADNSSYYDLHLASSPLFGNVAYGANISPVTEAQVEPMVRKVRNEVRESSGVGYISVILRIMQPDGDVCIPSFLATIAGDNVDEYDKMLESRSNNRLLSTAIGGPCHTIYVAGIRGPSGEGAKPMLEMANKMMKVQNSPLRSGSLKRFIAHTEPTLAGMQRRLDSGNASNPALLAQIGRIGTMLKDARSMLSSPGGSAPAVYKR
ncbi:hypothetical protein ABL78_2822 [Leptomonas seymouri]|uniref:Present in the outer mitochondrial membrane proteome 22 n=1 Tax=Leptomonas seymouri TaxID=5684 RepID=A0A0N1I5P9_LEPSE|nr:hypothetical protein ABL78_2822 [Leptomonas seymouri]|eukprot:KPI88092.1 hypothetical protein ABL78_2822 [Leptomonas seymouri]